MRVLLVFWGSGEGGDATATVELARAMRDAGDEFELVACAYRHPTIFGEKCETSGVPVRLVSDPATAWAETKLRREEFHLVHVQTGRAIPKRADAVTLRKLSGRLPLIVTCHGPEPLWAIDYGNIVGSMARYVAATWFRYVVVPSEVKAAEWHEMSPWTKNVVSIPNVVRLLNRQERSRARIAFMVPDGAKVALFCGRLVDAKDPETFVRAMASLKSQRPELVGLMAGIGELEETVADLIKELEAPVRMLGFVKDLEALYSAADLFVQPSAYESFCITLFQAAAMGLPCVATRIPIFEELYRNQRAMRWFEPGDAEGCARAIIAGIDEVTPEDGEHLKAHMLRNYSAEKVLAMHRDLWRQAVLG